MTTSNSRKRSDSHWLKACALVYAVLVLPLGLQAQNYDAVGKRLSEAVKNGELTKAQAEIMMNALQKKSATKEDGFEAASRQIWSAVKSGEITKEEAEAKLAAMKKRSDLKKEKKTNKGNPEDKKLRKLKSEVKAGKPTGKEAKTKSAAIKKGAGQDKATKSKVKNPDGKKSRKPKTVVKSGNSTGKKAKAKQAGKKTASSKETGTKKKGAPKKSAAGAGHSDYEALKEKLKAAVRAGKLTEEEAKAKLAAFEESANAKQR